MATIQTGPVENVLAAEVRSDLQMSKLQSVDDPARIKWLRITLRIVGLAFIFGIYGFVIVWPSGWAWHMGGPIPHYLQMILGVYATLGLFLLIASRNPLEHLSLIWFTVWSSVVHAGIMGAQALANPEHIAHLWGDVPILLIIGTVLAFVTPRKTKGKLPN
jgi:hypothetical protein